MEIKEPLNDKITIYRNELSEVPTSVQALYGDEIDIVAVRAGIRVTVNAHTCVSVFIDPSDALALAKAVLASENRWHEYEDAMLNLRRSELTRELLKVDADGNSPTIQGLLDRATDRVLAAEAEVKRLKGK